MRRTLAILMTVFTGTVFGADYIKITIPTTATVTKIFFNSDQIGWAATSKGEVLSSFDGGKTWKLVTATSKAIKDIHFNNRVGYIVGERGLLMKSTNGGATWQDLSLNMQYNFTGVGISDDTTVIICGTDQNSMSKTKGVVFESRDNGATWKKHPWTLGNGYTDLAVYGPRKVYLLAIKKAFHSISNGTRYFSGTYEGDRMGLGFDFIDDWGFMVGHKGYFAYSNTHGRKWQEIADSNLTIDLFAVEMFDRNSGVAVVQDGTLMFFYDDGQRRVMENCGYKNTLRTVCITGNKIFIGGDGGLMMYQERFPRAKN